MNILVTGAAGFIGSNYVKYHLSNYKEDIIIGVDSLTYAGSIDNFNILIEEEVNRFKFIKGNILNEELIEHIIKEFEIKRIINFAAESHVDNSIENPHIFVESNIKGTHALLNICKKLWYLDGAWDDDKKFLQVSTDEVYGTLGNEGLFTETTPLDPRSPYSSSKASADLLCMAYFHTYNMPVLISRCSNNYGPNQHEEKLIPVIIKNALLNNNIPIYGDGKQVRDWLFVGDHCSAIDLILSKGKIGDVYNIGGNNEMENIELTKLILKYLAELTEDNNINEDLITHVKDRLGHDRRYGIDASKIEEELGWKSKTNPEDGIYRTVKWYLSNRMKNLT